MALTLSLLATSTLLVQAQAQRHPITPQRKKTGRHTPKKEDKGRHTPKKEDRKTHPKKEDRKNLQTKTCTLTPKKEDRENLQTKTCNLTCTFNSS
jgi:hypothetical protein